MSAKKAFVLRLDPEMLKELERWAASEFRSINGQVEYILFEALKKRDKNFKLKSGEGEKDE
ncbi:Arc family DNA-binding protein [Solitalea canadensis]|uniref:Arc-like DNA binding domain-containing protein n=1 Tax=Solitalea canadensis (strain ATCC 29591 / DSM 3403 / JCM 21819 / LMG 8368 / NBRC 15130 / NCIMB 12057 / USAM 9D) TaxID=929556 RepID=H8KWS5_SOLCM|nr:Arc family DNA-binding protein [Solitalea canadensis]AFD08254.1 hypothetical protein Solca_3244 [Solitalea canadensis DSM 3403]